MLRMIQLYSPDGNGENYKHKSFHRESYTARASEESDKCDTSGVATGGKVEARVPGRQGSGRQNED